MKVGRAVESGDVYVTEMLGVTILSSLIPPLLSSHFIFHTAQAPAKYQINPTNSPGLANSVITSRL